MTIVLPEDLVIGEPIYVQTVTSPTDLVVSDPIYLDFVTVEPPSGTTKYYVHNQTIPLGTWTINHDFTRYPTVTVIGSDNFAIITDIEYSSATTVVLTFAQPTTGKALLT